MAISATRSARKLPSVSMYTASPPAQGEAHPREEHTRAGRGSPGRLPARLGFEPSVAYPAPRRPRACARRQRAASPAASCPPRARQRTLPRCRRSAVSTGATRGTTHTVRTAHAARRAHRAHRAPHTPPRTPPATRHPPPWQSHAPVSCPSATPPPRRLSRSLTKVVIGLEARSSLRSCNADLVFRSRGCTSRQLLTCASSFCASRGSTARSSASSVAERPSKSPTDVKPAAASLSWMEGGRGRDDSVVVIAWRRPGQRSARLRGRASGRSLG